ALAHSVVKTQHASEVVEYLRRAYELEKVRTLVSQTERGPRGGISRVRSEQRYGATVGPEQSGDHLDHARLARAVRAEQSECLAGLQLEGHAIDRPGVTATIAFA